MLIPPTQKSRFTSFCTVRSYLVALFLALCFVAYLFPLSFLMGNSHAFDFGDIAQHVSGWWFYARDVWHFPLLHNTRLNHPEGISVALTDSIPLMALPFKLLLTWFPSWFPAHFHYFGWWIGLVFVGQALSATLLMRTLGAKSLFAVVISVGFALTWPVIHARYHHAALMMQSVIIFALALYFGGRNKTWSSQQVCIAFIALSLISLTIHPYFLPFTAGLFVAFLLDQALTDESWWLQLKRLTFFGLTLFVTMWLLGYLDRKAPLSGFGDFFFLDLKHPFCGGSKLIHCGEGPVYEFPYFEGFNYLGAGLLLLIPFAILMNRHNVLAFPKRYPALLALLIGFFLYALSNRVRMNGAEILSFPLPAWTNLITGTFRASGRFFWLISNFILFATLASLLRRRSKFTNYFVAILLMTSLVLQIKDVKPWLERIKSETTKTSTINYSEWAPLMAHVDKVVVYPTYQCANPHYQHYIRVMQLAAYYDKLLNSGYAARSQLNCAADEVAINQPFAARHLYMVSSAYYHGAPFSSSFKFPTPFQQAMERGECVRRLDGQICLPGSTPEFWKSIAFDGSPIEIIPNGRKWFAADTYTRIGHIIGHGAAQRLQPKVANQTGWLSYGPSVSLPVGKYRYTLEYASGAAATSHVGNWDFALNNEAALASGALLGTNGHVKKIEGIVDVLPSDANKQFEIRTFFLAQGDLQVVSSSLQKVL